MSDTIGAELVLRVSQLAGVLHQEARLADELAGPLRLDPAGAIAALGRLRGLLLFVVFLFLGRRDPILQDGVEVGLHVVGVGLLLVLVLVLAVVALGLDGHDDVVLVLVVIDDHDIVVAVQIVHEQVVVDDERVLVQVLVQVFDEIARLVIEVLRILDLLVLADVVVSQACPRCGGLRGALGPGS